MIKGAMTALITPFHNNKIDEVAYEQLIKRQIIQGIDVVVPVGTTGESATLTHNEHKQCIEIAIESCKNTKTKVLAGAGSNATHESIDLAKFAQRAGADGVLVVTPYYNKPTQEGLFQHYKAIADSIDIDVVLYNVPGRTGVEISIDTIDRLSQECRNINSIKEAAGSLERCVAINHNIKNFGVISGDDAINYPILANGGSGVISVTSNLLPNLISKLVNSVENNRYSEALELNNSLYDMNKILFIESNPIPIKAAMFIAGLIPTLEYRLPMVAPSTENYAKLKKVVERYMTSGLIMA
jgi:4-hydroxy-tetrahydrodipicolinate synthase